jgi:very-short-patch-repair endonuclease
MHRHLAELAETQHALVTYEQLRARGFSNDAVWRMCRVGELDPVSERVYRMPGSPRTWEQRLCGLVLAAGPGAAAASHRSAAALLGLPGFRRHGRVEAVTRRPRRHRDATALVHRWRVLPDDHITVVDAIPCTRVARTLVDLAGVLHPGATERAVDNALAMRVVTVASLQAVFDELACRGRKGIAVMRRILDARPDDFVPVESALEARFVDLVRLAGLPEPTRQLDIGDDAGWIGRVDFAYPEARLVIELDGSRHHSARLDQLADRTRDSRLGRAGWRTVRIRWDDLVVRADDIVALVEQLLADHAA